MKLPLKNSKRLTIFGVTQQLSAKYWNFNKFKGYKDYDIPTSYLTKFHMNPKEFVEYQHIFNKSDNRTAKRLMSHIALRLQYFLSNGNCHKSLKDLCNVAMILHNKDIKVRGQCKPELKRAHIHIYGKLQRRSTLLKIAKIIGVKPQYITFGKGRYASENMQAYLIHADDDSKYQYNPKSVHTFGTYDYEAYYHNHAHKWKLNEARQAKRRHQIDKDWVVKEVQSGQIPDKLTLLKNPQLSPIYADNMKPVDDAFQYAMEHKSALTATELNHYKFAKTIIYINGKPGSGKTVFSKRLIQRIKVTIKAQFHRNWTSYIGATTNPFDDYNGQDIILLDDARSNTLSATDWLKIMDPVLMPRISARYHNKFMAARVIIITSYQKPYYLFSHTDMNEDLSQFMRRLTKIIKIIRPNNDDLITEFQDIYKLSRAKSIVIDDDKSSTQYVSKITSKRNLNDALNSLVNLVVNNNLPNHIYKPRDKPNISEFKGDN